MSKLTNAVFVAIFVCSASTAAGAQSIQRPIAGAHPIENLHFLLGVWNCDYFLQTKIGLDQQYSSTITYRLMPGGHFIGSDEVIVSSIKGYPLGWRGSEFIGRDPQPSYVYGTPENLQPLEWLIAGGEGGYAGWLNGAFILQSQNDQRVYLKHAGADAIEWDWPIDKRSIASLERCKRRA